MADEDPKHKVTRFRPATNGELLERLMSTPEVQLPDVGPIRVERLEVTNERIRIPDYSPAATMPNIVYDDSTRNADANQGYQEFCRMLGQTVLHCATCQQPGNAFEWTRLASMTGRQQMQLIGDLHRRKSDVVASCPDCFDPNWSPESVVHQLRPHARIGRP